MFKNWTVFEKLLLFVNCVIGLMFLTTGADYSILPVLGFVSSVANTLCVILVAKRKLSNYAWGVLGTLTYGFVAFSYMNTGEWMLNWLYYMPMNLVGWYMWSKNSDNGSEVRAKRLTLKQSLVVYSLTAVGVIMYALIISQPNVQMFLYGTISDFGFSKFLIDSTSTILSIVAMILLVKCYREQWVLWIVVNIMSIVLWFITFDAMMILQWFTLLANSVYGYICWSKDGGKNV